MSWIDEIKNERVNGVYRPLLQSQHLAVNNKHPHCTDENGRYGIEFYGLPMMLWYNKNEICPLVGRGFSWYRSYEN